MDLSNDEIEQLRNSSYEIQREIGRGTSGVVYLARQIGLDRDVALKHVHIRDVSNDTSVRRLEREVSALVNLEHPGVVRLMDVLRFRSSMWFVMEYVDGPTLREILELSPGGLSAPDALSVTEGLAAALDYVATRGVVHRDLKPANVFLTRDGRCKVGDFGIALLDDRTDGAIGESRLTAPGIVVGTPAYMSPEQVSGSSEITSAADLYALGSITYELFVGRPPFVGRGNVLALLLAQQSDPPPRPSEFLPGLTPDFEAALLAPLAKLPADRPTSPGAFWSKLKSAADRLWPDWERSADPASLSRRFSPSKPFETDLARSGGDTSTKEAEFEDLVEVHERSRQSASTGRSLEAPVSFDTVAVRVPRASIAWRRWLIFVIVFVIALVAAFAIAKAVSTRKSGVSIQEAPAVSLYMPHLTQSSAVQLLKTRRIPPQAGHSPTRGGILQPVRGVRWNTA